MIRSFLMQQFPATNETRPNGPVDLTDQSTMFLVLEELGITHMQDEWLRANAPGSPDLETAVEQHREFFEDLCGILNGEAGEDRVVANGWAGERLVAHLRSAVPDVLGKALGEQGRGLEGASGRDVLAAALRAFERSLSRLTAREATMKAAGGTMSAEEYIQLMAGWSALLCGLRATLELAPEVVPYD